MTYTTPPTLPADLYPCDCRGDAVVGDNIVFAKARFAGSFRRPRFDGYEIIEAVIVGDSYGRGRQQHTFTLKLADGSTIKIKGRNLYANGLRRKAWTNETERETVLRDKHTRGDSARSERDRRLNND